jgi:hypothetical protein
MISSCHRPIAASGATMIGNKAAAAPASIWSRVPSPRWRVSTPKTTMIAIASPASGHTSHICNSGQELVAV